MMSAEYDLHLYSNPVEGMDTNVYWGSPRWWVPLAPSRPIHTPHNLHQVPGGQGILTSLLNVFKQKRRKIAAQEAVAGDGGGEEAGTGEWVLVEATPKDNGAEQGEESSGANIKGQVEVEDIPPSLTDDLEDLGLALTALFAESTRLGEGELLPTMEAALLPGESCSHSPGRCVKFADDLGLPLTAVLVFEGEDEEEEEAGEGDDGTTEAGGKRSRRFRLTKRKRRAVSLPGSPKTTGVNSPPGQGYQRFYKPYMEEYDTRRVTATGAFTMVGF